MTCPSGSEDKEVENKNPWPILIQNKTKQGLDQFQLVWDFKDLPLDKDIKIIALASSNNALQAALAGYDAARVK